MNVSSILVLALILQVCVVIVHAQNTYSCSSPMENDKQLPTAKFGAFPTSPPQLQQNISSNFVRILRSGYGENDGMAKEKRLGHFFRIYKLHCHQPVLLLPLSVDELASANFEVLPNQQVCLNGKKMKNACMPHDSMSIQLPGKHNIWTMFVSAGMVDRVQLSMLQPWKPTGYNHFFDN